MTAGRAALGRSGEDRAAAWYQAQGFEVLARNWRVRAGELDLVARKGAVIVVCEVKTRSSSAFGHPLEAVTAAKAARIRRLAAQFLAEQGVRGQIRFDVVAILGNELEVVEAAF